MRRFLCILDAESGLGNVGVFLAPDGKDARARFRAAIGDAVGAVHVYDLSTTGDGWLWDISGTPVNRVPIEFDEGRPPTDSMRAVLLSRGVMPNRVRTMSFSHAKALLEALRERDGPFMTGDIAGGGGFA